jgi:TPR repeat protein
MKNFQKALFAFCVSLAVSGAAPGAALPDEHAAAARNDDAALNALRKRAADGLVDAEISLGEIYFTGSGAAQDYAEAAKWFRIAAERGFPDTTPEIGLATMYAQGLGVPIDATESLKWYRRAAVKGDPLGQFKVGVMSLRGLGTAIDYLEAYKWLTLCASEYPDNSAITAIIGRKFISPAQRSEADKWVHAQKSR